MRYFNCSGPNNPQEHYTLLRPALIAKGIDFIKRRRYFTIWAPRQSGKSTYFLLLKQALEREGYAFLQLNFENYGDETSEGLLRKLHTTLTEIGLSPPEFDTYARVSDYLETVKHLKLVLMVDEVEGLNRELLRSFLHTIRNLYHSRDTHSLKSVIFVGVSNLTGVVGDNASPFNIADEFHLPYFTLEETFELLGQHEAETGQRFERKVVRKIHEVTAGQPGLVNAFAHELVSRHADDKKITYAHYLEVEQWYLEQTLEKHFANILQKANAHRSFVEMLLFTEAVVPFKIDRPAIKDLYVNGIIRPGKNGLVEFWVPYYKKRLYDAFYPYTNGELTELTAHLRPVPFLEPSGELDVEKLIAEYKAYAARRGFGVFREKNAQGQYVSIKEAGLLYSFETFLTAFVQQAGGKTYREANTGLGKSDLVVNLRGQELLFEAKRYYGLAKFERGKQQAAYYARSLGLKKAVCVVFTPNSIQYPPEVREERFTLKGVEVSVFLVPYDEEKDF
ncbi:MAG: AAA-like domain-containing protein [Saprospiraceae bacterium]|nr:AAA-like domain-containing protein [Saprospiraceae bacterium]MDW8229498.1 AAA-like domain-containing protein [Saprospiraceae bacterium]